MPAKLEQVFVDLRIADPETVGELNYEIPFVVKFGKSFISVEHAELGSPAVMVGIEDDRRIVLNYWDYSRTTTERPTAQYELGRVKLDGQDQQGERSDGDRDNRGGGSADNDDSS